ncbi:hypothetical protein K435DRAFT_761376 [Dendrothele bispora CBS 962.96]|uniref:G-protein coupled receptors family 1 profile domain-containing protein n=1 Tax=Dendrothele bispora (strain CBS 962.96) TaxID=1314807 RepID=A0A4S8LIW3_DENBC|nr:hypothetical protein K435DRAFT_761376 [Dendrothele bispora CBS 962.96]
MTSINDTAIPNPFTPLAFIPPDIAVTAQLGTYLIVGSLGMFLWDVLIHLPLDWKLVFEHKVRIPTIAYFISRISSFAYLLVQAIFVTAPLPDCQRAVLAQEASYFVSTSATSFLFFLRVRAIYNRNPIVGWIFFVLWVLNVGCSSLAVLLVDGVHLGPTQHCVYGNPRIVFAFIAAVSVLIYDTSVFIAISIKLYDNSHIRVAGDRSDSNKTRISSAKEFVSGSRLPRFSRAVLKDGQAYYFVVFLTTIVIVALLFIPSPSSAFHLMMITPHIAIVNSMSCYVYRNVRFGIIREVSVVSSILASRSTAPTSPRNDLNLLPLHRARNQSFTTMTTPDSPVIDVRKHDHTEGYPQVGYPR